MIDLAASAFPVTQRGVATSLILGAGDVGMLLGFGLLGESISRVGFDLTIVALALTLLACGAVYAWRTAGRVKDSPGAAAGPSEHAPA